MTPLVAGCLWVLLGTFTAMLPMRYQRYLGGALLLSAPFLIAWLIQAYGWWIGAVALFAVLSLFRKPLAHLARKATRP